MIRATAAVFAPLALLWAAPAIAADPLCPAGTVCAADPGTIAAALQDAGYKAKLDTSKRTGNPLIQSSAQGYDFEVQFNECKDSKGCKSLGFVITFNNDDNANTIELANAWNDGHRFSTMSLGSDKSLTLAYDVSTAGGLTKANIADVIDWWAVTLGEVRTFFNTQSTPAASGTTKDKSG